MPDINRIVAGIYLDPGERYKPDGTLYWNPHFIERLKDWTDFFNMRLTDSIEAALGPDGWAVSFVQISQLEESFFVDIFLDNPENFEIISGIINANIPGDIKLKTHELKGNISVYMQNQ
jgi:hypothetical protein